MADRHDTDTNNVETDSIEDLRQRLQEAEDTLEAIRQGSVDALVIKDASSNQQQIFTLKSSDRSYRLLIESMSQAALTITQDGLISYCNIVCATLFNKKLSQVIGSQIFSYFKPEDRESLQLLLDQSSQQDLELEVPSTHGRSKTVLISPAPLEMTDAAVAMGLIITDITERTRADQAKDEFISLASHQLRTPATGVKQYLGMLLEGYVGDLSDENRIYVQTAYNSNERQLTIINDILKTAQIDSGTYKLKRRSSNVGALVQRAIVEYQPIMGMRGQTIAADIDDSVMAQMDGNELYLAVANLLENASKYSPDGKMISIMVSQTKNMAVISIKDQGVGIHKADQARIFEKFTRVDNELSDTVSGTGLGLYWVKRIVEVHQGSVSVRSKLHSGSEFRLEIPIE